MMNVNSCAMRGRSDGAWHASAHQQRLEVRRDVVSNSITSLQKDYMI